MFITFVIAFTINALSTFAMWNYVRIAHSKDGIWYGDADFADAIMTFTPVVNTMAAIVSWLSKSPHRKSGSYYNRLFRVKK